MQAHEKKLTENIRTDRALRDAKNKLRELEGNDSNLLIVFYVQIMPDDLVMQLHRF
ncbi:fimbriae usher protein StfC [Escherichia coli]|nr:fimbriae usher protein StfC [Escherichia coli]EFO0730805.1 fimbriae usher protein StfC [Escherichia coli]EGD7216590.1 fimbriae usher protein StfC [Escherichia coli]EGD9276631.1 fimbriae usher protein StfC [Escherichia coli]EGE3355244.1 fimbriae usher protein StfC [Escherichia coli]